MATASVSGLVSGLDTATIVNQLMQLEATSQNRLKSRVTSEQSVLKVLQGLNAKFAAMATQAKGLSAPGAWSPISATSSDKGVTVATTSGTSAGSLSFQVDAVAVAGRLTFGSTAALSDVVVPLDADGLHTVTLTVGGTSKQIDAGDGTLRSLVSALNAGGSGVSAATLKLDGGAYRLMVQSTTTGAASSLQLTASDGSDLLGGASAVAGSDAAITIGGDTVHSATNTFTDLLPGVSVTVSAAAVASTVEVTVSRDASQALGKAKALVEAINASLSEIDTQTKYNAISKTSGALTSESAVRDLRTALLQTVYPGDGSTLAGIGIQTDRFGKLVLDETAFSSAYNADAAAVAEKLGGATGMAGRVAAVATSASDPYTGTLTSAATGRSTGIARLQDSIDKWDLRLELRRTTLERQFTSLETALNKMNSQSTWLAGQISSLSGSSR